jgi:Mrp family chromosome partitioning ATPase/capsular polysaccharide biosynthesis protein
MTSPRTNSSPQPETTDFRDYVRPIWAHKFMILVLVAAVTAGTYWYYNRQPRVYQSSTQVFVGTTDSSAAPELGDDRVLVNQAQLLRTPKVAARVAKDIGFKGDPSALLGAISVTPTTGSDFLLLTGTAGDPNFAALVANGFAEAFIHARSDDAANANNEKIATLTTQLEQTTDRTLRKAIQSRINDVRLDAITSNGGEASQVTPAVPNGLPLSPHPRRNAIFGFALSLLLGVIGAFGLERVNRKIRSPEEAERAFGLPIIASVRRARDIAPRIEDKAAISDTIRETFRFLRSNLELSAADGEIGTLLVTSGIGGEGKSTVVRNLALVYAEAGLRVAIVEADFRRPSLATTLGAHPGPGLSNVLIGIDPLNEVVQRIETYVPTPPVSAASEVPHSAVVTATAVLPRSEGTGVRNGNGSRPKTDGRLDIVTSGPRASDPPALFSSADFRAVLDRLARDHDLVIIDSPPLIPVSDSLPLLSVADATVLVCRVGKTSVDDAEHTLELVSRTPGARVLGLVVNDVEGGLIERRGSY